MYPKMTLATNLDGQNYIGIIFNENIQDLLRHSKTHESYSFENHRIMRKSKNNVSKLFF